jgi:hypothetical protein
VTRGNGVKGKGRGCREDEEERKKVSRTAIFAENGVEGKEGVQAKVAEQDDSPVHQSSDRSNSDEVVESGRTSGRNAPVEENQVSTTFLECATQLVGGRSSHVRQEGPERSDDEGPNRETVLRAVGEETGSLTVAGETVEGTGGGVEVGVTSREGGDEDDGAAEERTCQYSPGGKK